MNKIIPIMVLVLLSSSALFIAASSDSAEGATERMTYENTLLPDVYKLEVNNVSSVDVRYVNYYDTYFSLVYRIYKPGTDINLGTQSIPDSDYVYFTGVMGTGGPGLLYIFAYKAPSEMNIWINGSQINSNTLETVSKGTSLQFFSGQPVKITLNAYPMSTMYLGLGTWNQHMQITGLETDFTISAPGDWRIYPSGNGDISSQFFLSFTVEYEDVPKNTETYGYLILGIAGACIGVLALSAGRQKIKG